MNRWVDNVTVKLKEQGQGVIALYQSQDKVQWQAPVRTDQPVSMAMKIQVRWEIS
jgi:hypothetical protein